VSEDRGHGDGANATMFSNTLRFPPADLQTRKEVEEEEPPPMSRPSSLTEICTEHDSLPLTIQDGAELCFEV
jgi:hypothetical protein